MPVMLNHTQEIESGNVAALLSSLSGVNVSEIEKILSCGVQPRDVAKKLGVDNEFCEILKKRLKLHLSDAVKKSLITKQNAEEISNSFREVFFN